MDYLLGSDPDIQNFDASVKKNVPVLSIEIVEAT